MKVKQYWKSDTAGVHQAAAWLPVLVPTTEPAGWGHTLLSTTGGSGSDDKPTVRVERRRKQTTPPGEREQAAAPERQREEGSPAKPGSGGSGGGGSFRPRPAGGGGSRSPIMGGGALLVLILCLAVYFLFQGGDDSGEVSQPPPAVEQDQGETAQDFVPTELPVAARPTTAARPTATPRSEATPRPAVASQAASGEDQKWLVMLYQDADDKILEQDIFVDMNEAERAGSGSNVQIVSQLDRYKAGFQGDGNWSSTKRFYVTRDRDLNTLASQEIADLGETNMADGQTLVDFVTWAMATYPSDKYVLILSDHGMGWPGGWSDPTASSGGDRRIPLTTRVGDLLFLNEMDQALEEIRSQTGLDKFELIGLDACLMGQLEVYDALAPHARYAVASQETEPALGWAYTSFLDALEANPNITGGELGAIIVESYIQDDQRIVDDQARAEYTGRRASASSAAQVAQQLEQSITLTAIDLGAVPDLMDSVNGLSIALQQIDQKGVAKARSYAQNFTSIFGSDVPPSYIDLANLIALIKRNTDNDAVNAAADDVLAAIDGAVISEKHGPEKPGARGVSIYFPNSQLYGNPYAGPQSYTAIAERFASESAWDDFLAFHYTGQRFDEQSAGIAAPARTDAVRAAVAGSIEVSPITLSGSEAAPGEPVLMSVDINGENVGYVKLLVGFYDQAANSINLIDTDYLQSPETREIDGVYYPVWPEGEFTMEFEWEPFVTAISDGTTSAEALFKPESYGKSREEATYTVDGTYTYADGGETRSARMYFRNGQMQQVFGFTGDGSAGSPREILPQPGDTFTVLETWLDLDAQGSVQETATQQGKTLTFGDQPFQWKELDAAAGRYVVGFLVEDLDGQATATYSQVTVP